MNRIIVQTELSRISLWLIDQRRQNQAFKIAEKWGRTSAQNAVNWIEQQPNLD